MRGRVAMVMTLVLVFGGAEGAQEVNKACNVLGKAAETGALARAEGVSLRRILQAYQEESSGELARASRRLVERYIRAGYGSLLKPEAARRSYTIACIEAYAPAEPDDYR